MLSGCVLGLSPQVQQQCPHLFQAVFITALHTQTNCLTHAGAGRLSTYLSRVYSHSSYLADIRCYQHFPTAAAAAPVLSFAGFCGETEAEHAATVDLLRNTRYDNAFLFSYSERGKTHAARHLADDVPEDIKARRLREAQDAFRAGQRELIQAEVGRVHLVLIEGRARKGEGLWQGRSCTMKRVVVGDVAVPGSMRKWQQQQKQGAGWQEDHHQQQQQQRAAWRREHQQQRQEGPRRQEDQQQQEQDQEGPFRPEGWCSVQQPPQRQQQQQWRHCERQQQQGEEDGVVEDLILGQQQQEKEVEERLDASSRGDLESQQEQQQQQKSFGWPQDASSDDSEGGGDMKKSWVRIKPGDYVAVWVEGWSAHSTLTGAPLGKTSLTEFVSWSGGSTVAEKEAFETLKAATGEVHGSRTSTGSSSSSSSRVSEVEWRSEDESREAVAAAVGSA